jgi:hypothetical protein
MYDAMRVQYDTDFFELFHTLEYFEETKDKEYLALLTE